MSGLLPQAEGQGQTSVGALWVAPDSGHSNGDQSLGLHLPLILEEGRLGSKQLPLHLAEGAGTEAKRGPSVASWPCQQIQPGWAGAKGTALWPGSPQTRMEWGLLENGKLACFVFVFFLMFFTFFTS